MIRLCLLNFQICSHAAADPERAVVVIMYRYETAFKLSTVFQTYNLMNHC